MPQYPGTGTQYRGTKAVISSSTRTRARPLPLVREGSRPPRAGAKAKAVELRIHRLLGRPPRLFGSCNTFRGKLRTTETEGAADGHHMLLESAINWPGAHREAGREMGKAATCSQDLASQGDPSRRHFPS